MPVQNVGVEISQQEDDLEKDHAGRPDGLRPPEPGEDDPGENELHLEQQERAKSDHGGEEDQEIYAFRKKMLPNETNSCSMTPI
jgi:hypothetical protein